MIKELVKDCIIGSGLSTDDLVHYCNVDKATVVEMLKEGDYSVTEADRVLECLGMFAREDSKMLPKDRSIPHIELDNCMVLFRRQSRTECRFLVVSAKKNDAEVKKMSENCFRLSL